MSHYTFSIDNQSGYAASYAIFAEKPQILTASGSAIDVSTPIITSVHAVPSPQGQATIMLPKHYYATCGIYDIAPEPADGDFGGRRAVSGTEVIDNRMVELGYVTATGVKVPGTSLLVDCSTGTPSFSTAEVQPISQVTAQPGFFVLRTNSDFTIEAATSNKYFLGFTSSMRHSIGPHAVFTPQPTQVFQIAPSNIFYVAVSAAEARDPVDPSLKEKPTCKIDFGALARDHVVAVHRPDGSLTISPVTPSGTSTPMSP